MFNAEEIRQITFEKVMRGYRTEDVESFIENIADQFEALEKEKKDLEEKLYLLAEKVEQYKAEEESIKTTLINAQRLGESIVSDARVKADNLIREATIKKNDIISFTSKHCVRVVVRLLIIAIYPFVYKIYLNTYSKIVFLLI